MPVANPAWAWWQAARALDSRLSYEYVMGMCGGVGDMLFCLPGCLCLERALIRCPKPASLKRLGFSARPVTSEDHVRIRRSLDRGIPVPWFESGRAGVLVEADPDPRRFRTKHVSLEAGQAEEWLRLEDLHEATLYVIHHLTETRGSRTQREAMALAEWVAMQLEPPVPLLCDRCKRPIWSGRGEVAYDQMSETVAGPWTSKPRAGERMIIRLRWWLDARRAGVEFLNRLAGKKRTALANRLRRAAGVFDRERQALEALISMISARRMGDLRPEVSRARELSGEAIWHLMEAAFLAARLPSTLRDALMESPDTPLAGTSLQEVIYLARSGAHPFRQLAARRLVGADSPQATSTLSQLIYDSHPPTAQMAIWALRGKQEVSAKVFADAFANLTAEDSCPSTIALLLHAMSDRAEPAVREVLRSAAKIPDRGGRSYAIVRLTAADRLGSRSAEGRHSMPERRGE